MAGYIVGEWTVHHDLNQIVRGDQTVTIEPRVMALLYCFAQNPGRVFNRDDLIEHAWNGNIISDNTINYTIGMLRKALGDKARSPEYIQTVAKKGYRFIADVKIIEATNKTPQQKELPTATGTGHQNEHSSKKGWRRFSSLALVAILLLAVTAALGLWPQQNETRLFSKKTPFTTLPGEEFGLTLDSTGNWVYFSHIKKGEPYADIYKQHIGSDRAELALPATPDTHEASPALSPDGNFLAYARFHDAGNTLYLHDINSGQPDEELLTSHYHYPAIQWTPDGDILFLNAEDKQSPARIKRLNINSGKVQNVVDNNDSSTDYAFALSHDGTRIVFMRTQDWNSSQLFLKDLASGEETLLKEFPSWFFEFVWTPDDKTILFTPDSMKSRIDAYDLETGTISTVYNQVIGFSLQASVKNSRKLLALQRDWDTNIHRLPLKSEILALKNEPNVPIIATTRSEWIPTISPDDKKLAFVSDRSGGFQIWTSDIEGQNPTQITKFNDTIKFRSLSWDKSCEIIVFDNYENQIFLASTISGKHHRVLPDDMTAKHPIFSPDNKSIIFSSNKSGDWQLWQIPVSGGKPVQLTTGGGYSAQVAPDGTLVIDKFYKPGLWRFNIAAQDETLITPDVNIEEWRQWTARDSGVYYTKDHDSRIQLFYFNWQSGQSERIFDTPHFMYTFAISHDEQDIFFTRDESKGSDIVIIE